MFINHDRNYKFSRKNVGQINTRKSKWKEKKYEKKLLLFIKMVKSIEKKLILTWKLQLVSYKMQKKYFFFN